MNKTNMNNENLELLVLKETLEAVKIRLSKDKWELSMSRFRNLTGGGVDAPDYLTSRISAVGKKHRIYVDLMVNLSSSNQEVLIEIRLEKDDEIIKEHSFSGLSENSEEVQIFFSYFHQISNQYPKKINSLLMNP